MNNEIKILVGLMADMPEKKRLEVIEAAKLIQTFLRHLEADGEVSFVKAHRSINKNPQMTQEVGNNLGLKVIQRKKTKLSRRNGAAWVRK